MAVGVADRLFPLVVKEVLRLGGYIQGEGTSTAGSATTLTDASNFRVPTAQATAVTGRYVWMFSGTGILQQAEVTTYTIGVFTWIPTLTSPAADTGWVLCNVRPQAAIDAIAEVTRKARQKQAIEFTDESIITNNLLGYYPTFEHWDNGAALAPDGFTLAGAGSSIARENTIVSHGKYSAAVTAGAGAVATLTRTVPIELNILMKGHTLHLLGMIAENVAGDITVRVTVTNAAGTATNSDWVGTLTSNRWQELTAAAITQPTLPVVTDPNATVALQTRTALSAVTYADDICLYGPYIYDYILPWDTIGIDMTIEVETGYRTRQFASPLHFGSDWTVGTRGHPDRSGQTRQIQFNRNRPLPSGRHLRMKLYRESDVIATATGNVEPDPAWLATASALRLVKQYGPGNEHVSAESLKDDLDDMERTPQGDATKGKHIVWFENR